MEGNLRYKIDWASLTVEGKFTVFALFYFVFGGTNPSTSPQGAYIWRGDLTEGFRVTDLRGLYLEGLIFGILRYVVSPLKRSLTPVLELPVQSVLRKLLSSVQ